MKAFWAKVVSKVIGPKAPEQKLPVTASKLIHVFEPMMVPEDSQDGKCGLHQAIKSLKEYIDNSKVSILTNKGARQYYNALTKIQKSLPTDITNETTLEIPVSALTSLADNEAVINQVIESLGIGTGRGVGEKAFLVEDAEDGDFDIRGMFTHQTQTADKNEVKADLLHFQARLHDFFVEENIEKTPAPMCPETQFSDRKNDN